MEVDGHLPLILLVEYIYIEMLGTYIYHVGIPCLPCECFLLLSIPFIYVYLILL